MIKHHCTTCHNKDCEFHIESGTSKRSPVEKHYVWGIMSIVGCQSHVPLRLVCKHTEIISSDPGESYSSAECKACGETFGWYCPDSPDHKCHYSKSYDQCDYCGHPEERK